MKPILHVLCLLILLCVSCKKDKQQAAPEGCSITSLTSGTGTVNCSYKNGLVNVVNMNTSQKNYPYQFIYDSLNRIEKIITEGAGDYIKFNYLNNQVSEYITYRDGIQAIHSRLYYTDGLLSKSEIAYSGSEGGGYTLFVTNDQKQIIQTTQYIKIGSDFSISRRQSYTYSAVKSGIALNLVFNLLFNTANTNILEHLNNACLPATIRTESFNPTTGEVYSDYMESANYITNEKGYATSFEIGPATNPSGSKASISYNCN